jgi:hypothetical protein
MPFENSEILHDLQNFLKWCQKGLLRCDFDKSLDNSVNWSWDSERYNGINLFLFFVYS